jgi:PAS domain S-box-containing protein
VVHIRRHRRKGGRFSARGRRGEPGANPSGNAKRRWLTRPGPGSSRASPTIGSFPGRRGGLGLVWQFAIAFSALTLVAGAFLYAAVRNYSEDSIGTTSQALMGNARDAVFSRVDADFAHAERMVMGNAALARHGVLPLDDERRLCTFFLEQVSIEPSLDYLYFANEKGGIASGGTDFGQFRRIYTEGMEGGVRIVERVDSSGALLARLPPPRVEDYDPRERAWYRAARERRHLVWGPPIYGTVAPPRSLTLNYPLFGPSGEFQGVFGGNVLLDSLGGYLAAHRSTPNSHLMLLEPDGGLVANSSGSPLFTETGGELRRLGAETVPQPFAREAAGLVRRAHGSRNGTFSALMREGGREYYVDVAPYARGRDIRWYLVSVVPRSDFTGPLDALWSRFWMVLLGGAAGAVALSLVMAGWVTRPMRAINGRVMQIAAGRFGDRVETRRRDEIGQLVHSFNDMSGRLAGTYEEIRGKNEALDAANRDLASLLERERLRRMDAEAEGMRDRILGEATAALSETQEYDLVLGALPRALVRAYVDWAIVEVAAPGGTTRTAAAHREPDKEALLRELIGKYPARMTSESPGAGVLETGEPLHLPAISEERIRSWCVDDVHAEGIRRLGTRSSIIVPLIARRKRVGVLALVSASPDRFGPADVGLAAELGRRAALAFDNARLYADLQREGAELKRAEAARRKTEDLLHGIVEKAPALIYVKDLDGRYLLVNRQMAEVIGVESGSVLGKTASAVFPPEQARAVAEFDRRVLAAGEALGGEEEVTRADGLHTYYSIEAPLTGADGRVYALCGIATDITARKRAEEALRRSEGQLRQAQKLEAIGKLAGGIAHDFNNLLSVILGYSSMMLEGMEPGDVRRPEVEEIDRAGKRAAALTQQLLAFGRKQLLQPRVISLGDVVAGVESMLRRLIGENIELSVRTDPDLGRVRADPGSMEQVVMNLAVNARDAMPRGGRLAIETANADLDRPQADRVGVAPGPYVVLTVADNGVGMDSATRARIFEPFFTTKEVGKGTGLGLATVFGIVQQSGGRIGVESEPGRGAAFRVYLPRTEAIGETERESGKPAPGASGGSEAILLVEDDDQVRALARAILQRSGYQVIEARTGGDALLVAERGAGSVDLLLTDVIMPHISGPQLAERLGLRVRKVLYMSGYTEDSTVLEGLVDASVSLLQKPITPEALVRKVREVLESPPDAYRPPAPRA